MNATFGISFFGIITEIRQRCGTDRISNRFNSREGHYSSGVSSWIYVVEFITCPRNVFLLWWIKTQRARV